MLAKAGEVNFTANGEASANYNESVKQKSLPQYFYQFDGLFQSIKSIMTIKISFLSVYPESIFF